MLKDSESNELALFLELVTSLEPIEFVGVLKILDVSTKDPDGKVRKFDALLSETIDQFVKLNRRQRRNIIRLIKTAKKER